MYVKLFGINVLNGEYMRVNILPTILLGVSGNPDANMLAHPTA
jgi:hypothetical protein